MGVLNSWLIWQMLGIYPVVTQTVYRVGSPFEGRNMTVNGNETLRIRANVESPGFGQDNFYV